MKAIRVHQFGGPEVLLLEEVPTPVPAAGQVLVRLHAIGVNPVETYQRSGSNPALKLPWTPGLDGAGVVEAVDTSVTSVQVGDRVYTSDALTGTYAEFTLAPAAGVHPLPAPITFQQGAALNIPYATAYRALFQRARIRAGEIVLVHGASGAVGVAATQFARAAGCTIIGTAGTEAGRKLVQAQGAHFVLDHRDPSSLEHILSLTHGRGADVILEMLANVNLGRDLTMLAQGGRIVVIGSRGSVEITPRELMRREGDVLGLMLFNATAADLKSIHAAIRAGLENGTLRPVVGRELPLNEVTKAHLAVLEPGAFGKIILRPGEP